MKSYQQDFRYTDKTTVSAVRNPNFSTIAKQHADCPLQVMVSLQNVGAFLAALGIFPVSERYGRKKTVQIACLVFCTGVLLQVLPSHSLVCFYIGRFISGLGLGSATAVVPSYNAEQAPKEIRGKLGSGMQLMFAAGVLISYWIDYATVHGMEVSSAQWQIPVGLQMLPAAILAGGLFFQKESVRWLAKKGRNDEAWENLKWMRADDGAAVKAEFNEIKTGIAEEQRASEGFTKRELLEPANRYRLLLAFGCFLGQQCTGMILWKRTSGTQADGGG
jgi:MFS family permease